MDSYTYSEFKSGSKFMNGDTLLARITPCLENGKTAYVDILDEDKIAFGSTEFFVLRPKDNLMDSHFLYYLMRTNELRSTIIKSMTGTSGRQRAQKESILEYEFCLPSLKIQTAIAKLLKNFDDKIETNKKIIANLEELSQTLFKRWIVDFEFPDENGNPYKSSGGEMVDSELGEKPINWDVAKLRSIVNIRTGYAFKSTEYVEQRQLPVLRTLNISKSNLLVTMNEIKYVPYQYLYMDKYKNYNLELFDTLLVTVGGSIGNLGLVTENNIPSLQNQNMWRFRSIKSNIGNTFVYQLILYVNSLVRNQTSGSAREFYTKKLLKILVYYYLKRIHIYMKI
ncbi:restriction endonuclease subunit S [Staphylococcus simulans]|uniref:restriction endonuclease subunit S n=1 Tax=Staphylococcus simulans TaxID=1286 RepID=UPI0021CDF321|nr:restriction endonuclease subunit S [Staphylococcus simulans]UXV43716.1 restriction endonuclease subunit S [Staphylococcus simulans]